MNNYFDNELDLRAELNNIQYFVINYLKTNNFDTLIIGISGGIDSALCLAILKSIKLPIKIFTYFLNLGNSNQNLLNAKLVCQSFNQELKVVNLDQVYESFKKISINQNNRLALGNIKSRLRMIYLYDTAQNLNALVVGCLNASELLSGFFTKHGDSGADIFLINNLEKATVRKMALLLKVPEEIINLTPSSDLFFDSNDELELGCSYKDISKYIHQEKLSIETLKIIKSLKEKNFHKKIVNFCPAIERKS